MSFIPSQYQLDIFNEINQNNTSVLIEATAGAGKSTTIIESVNSIPELDKKAVIFLSFNKAIAENLKSKLPESVKASTIHSLGLSIIKKNNPKAKMDAEKVHNCIEKLCKKWKFIKKDEKWAAYNRIRKLVDLARLNHREYFNWIDFEEVNELCSIECDEFEVGYAFQVYNKIIKNTKTYDFVDMVFMPVYNDYTFYQYDIVYCDEIQDLSDLERTFFLKLKRSDGRFIAVGDPNQSIYGFKGASINGFFELAKEPNVKIMPLSISYRCPKAVTEHANELVPTMQFRPGAPDGSVIKQGSYKNVKPGDVVLCRINAPMVRFAFDLIKDGIPVTIKGKDIGLNLIKLIEAQKVSNTYDLGEKLHSKLDKLIEKIKAKYPTKHYMESEEVITLTDKVDVICELANKFHSVNGIIDFLKDLYSEDVDNQKVTCSTIHRFKGGECKNIFILEPQLIPFPYYKAEEQKKQERNIDFVARTRAIEKLEYIRDWTFYKKAINQ